MEEQNTGQNTTPAESSTTESVTTPIETAPSQPSVEIPVAKVAWYKNKQLLTAVVVALILIGGAGYYLYDSKYKDGGVVAIVNGEKIYKVALDENIARMQQAATQQGVDISDATIQQKIQDESLQILIDNIILMSAAEKEGLAATEEEVKAKYDELVAQVGGEEEFKKLLEEAQLTHDELMKNIRERVIIDAYFAKVTDIENITVSDEEITEFLSAYPKEDLPPLEEIKPQVEAQIRNQKQQELITGILEKMRSEASIKKNI
ncbi:MAG TPA: SurA N-terminal domain-containing protein [Candidatus Paceibacterota bacterium]|nr:SurA N-terminal domain-containing protein [Candidatus Paceibacterota bacterium]